MNDTPHDDQIHNEINQNLEHAEYAVQIARARDIILNIQQSLNDTNKEALKTLLRLLRRNAKLAVKLSDYRRDDLEALVNPMTDMQDALEVCMDEDIHNEEKQLMGGHVYYETIRRLGKGFGEVHEHWSTITTRYKRSRENYRKLESESNIRPVDNWGTLDDLHEKLDTEIRSSIQQLTTSTVTRNRIKVLLTDFSNEFSEVTRSITSLLEECLANNHELIDEISIPSPKMKD